MNDSKTPLIPSCPRCGGDNTRLYGVYPNGTKSFFCRDCKRRFVDPAKRVHRPPAAEGQLLLKLRALADRIGRTPSTTDIRRLAKEKSFPYRECDYVKVFGGYTEAVRRAGLEPTYRREFTEKQKDVMLAELQALSRRLRRPISTDDVRAARRRGNVRPTSQLEKAFGSIRAAIEAAGVEVTYRYTDQEMLEILRALDRKLDRPVRRSDLEELFRRGKGPAPKVLLERFGGIRKARRAAGIKQKFQFANGFTGIQQRYSRRELIDQLKRLAKKLGRPPSSEDIDAAPRNECACLPTFQLMFGGIVEARRAAGLPATPFTFTDEEIVAALRSLKERLGRFPTHSDINSYARRRRFPSVGTIYNRLGPLSRLREWV